MKTRNYICVILLITLFITSLSGIANITRGPAVGELYLASPWYYDQNIGDYWGLFYSINYGETFEMLNYKTPNPPYNNMPPLNFMTADKTPGVLYCYSHSKLYRTDDYAQSWNLLGEGSTGQSCSSGITDGVIYRFKNDEEYCLQRSTNYGEEFSPVNEQLMFYVETGTNENELYVYLHPSPPEYRIILNFSNDNGESFEEVILDSTLYENLLSNSYVHFYSGVLPGELYLVTWTFPHNFHINFSADYGQTFELIYVSDIISFDENCSFSTGRSPGEFYFIITYPHYNYTNTRVRVYHSTDYAESFEEHIHIFDENFGAVDYGDLDENGEIQAFDASVLMQYVVGMNPLPFLDPLPWGLQRINAGDVDGNEELQAYDAALILQYSIGLITQFPVENGD